MLSSLLKKTTKNIIHDKFEINGGVYVEDALIGEGAYAYVYRVKDSHGKAFALKKLICQTDDQIKETKKEIKLLALIKHSNVLSLLDSSFHLNSKKQTEAFLLLPLYGKSAQDIIDQGPGYPHCAFELRSQVLKMLVQCIDAINAIHSSGYTHCDFKPANVLLDDNMNAIVTDFGSACPLTTEVTSRSQALSVQDHAASNTTASFRPPELFDTPSHCTIDGKVDVWGLGCTLFALMFSRTPFENPAEGGLSVLAVLSSTFTFPETCEWPPEYYTLIKASLRSDCSARLSIDELKILAGLLPNPDISEVTGAFGSPPVFEATPGLIVQPGPENLFANVSEISATVPGATDDNFAHFEDFGNFESNSTVFRAAEQTSSNRNNKVLSSKAASNVTMSKVDEGVDGNVAKLSLEERDTSNDSGAGKDNIDDDDSDFGDFVQAEVESKPETTIPSKKNVSMSAEANIMKTTKTGPFRTKSLVKKKVRIIVDNTWFCLKKIESQPGKIYFDGCLTKDSVVEEVSGSALGEYVFIVKGVEMTEDRRSSLAPIKAGEVLEGDNEIVGNSGAVEVGFDGVEVMNVWLKTLREQILQCQLSETE